MFESESRLFLVVLLIIYTAVVSLIGFKNRQNKNSEDYFLASRSLPAWLLAITFIASWWGGGSAIDLVDVAFKEGISSFWIYGIPVLLATALMYLFAAGIRRIATISQPQLMERRYDARSAMMLSIFIIIFMVIGAAIQVIVIGNFFSSFLGVSYELGAILGTSLVLLYSMFGGFRGVVLTDLLQFVFFLASSIILFVIAYSGSGGFESLQSHVIAQNKPDYISFFSGIENNLAYVITFGTSWIIQANVWQRISAAKTPKSAKKMMAISFFVFIPLYLMVSLTGMFSSVIYDVLPENGIVADQILQISNPVLSGILFIGLCSAIMSTMDSMFNTGALSLTIDLYKKYISPNKPASSYVFVGRAATVLLGALALFIGLNIKSVLTISWIGADFIATGAFIPLIFGFFWKRGTATAAFCTMIYGLIFSSYNFIVALGADLPIFWEIASAEQAMIGMCGALIIYIAVSLSSKGDELKASNFIDEVRIFKRRI